MIGNGLIRQRVTADNADFVEKLEQNLNQLPEKYKAKLQKLNFYSHAYDLVDDPGAQNRLKSAIIELLNDFINDGYHPIFVGKRLGYYIFSENLVLARLDAFKEIYDPNRDHSTSKQLLPAFNSKLSATAKPFIPKDPKVTAVEPDAAKQHLTLMA